MNTTNEVPSALTPDPTHFRVGTELGNLSVESSGVGPTILAWPSLFFGDVTLRSQVSALKAHYRVLLIDPPGHGRSDPPTRRFSLDDCGRAALDVLDHTGIERSVFLGTSWGGPVAVSAALISPKRFRGLVLMNAPMHGFRRRRRMEVLILSHVYRLLGPRAFLVRSVTNAQLSAEVRRTFPDREVALADSFGAADRRAMVSAIRSSLLSMPSLYPRLSELRVPTLFVTGALDTIIEVSQARSAAAAVAGSRFEVVPASAHQSGLEAPEFVNQVIGEFLRPLG
jgi:3-oxoadipate enol-lactonase